MSRKDFMSMQVRDLPQSGQHWVWKDELVRISGINTYSGRWFVGIDYIHDDGRLDFRLNQKGGPSVTCSDHMELGRFLQKARKA